jgi:hypothetical protein
MRAYDLVPASRQAERVFALIVGKGEEAVLAIKQFAEERKLGTCRITAVGAFERARLGFFDRDRKDYLPLEVGEQAEVLSLIGDIADDEQGRPSVHLHAVLGMRDGSTRGGHLLEGWVWPTLEIIVSEAPVHLKKRFDREVGLALIAAK